MFSKYLFKIIKTVLKLLVLTILTVTMKHKYINKGENDENKYLNNPPVIDNVKSRKKKISIIFSKM